MKEFHLFDLRSQAAAVKKFLEGKTSEEKIRWLQDQGKVEFNPQSTPDLKQTYWFESNSGVRTLFFFFGEELTFIPQ